MKTDREYRRLESKNRTLRNHLVVLERLTLQLANKLTRSQELLGQIEARVDLAQVFPDKPDEAKKASGC
jgi:hypothetical protein